MRPFFGMRFVGVSEFVVPIHAVEGKPLAFIRGAAMPAFPRIRAVASPYDLNADVMMHIFNYCLKPDVPHRAAGQTTAHRSALRIRFTPSLQLHAGGDPLCRQLLSYLDEQYNQPIALPPLRVRYHCGPSYFGRLPNQYSGCTFKAGTVLCMWSGASLYCLERDDFGAMPSLHPLHSILPGSLIQLSLPEGETSNGILFANGGGRNEDTCLFPIP